MIQWGGWENRSSMTSSAALPLCVIIPPNGYHK